MRPLRVALLPEYFDEHMPVSRRSTVQTARRSYSVDSRLIGETGAFAQYRSRPSVPEPRVSARLRSAVQGLRAARATDLDYLRILRLAAQTMECKVERVLVDLEQCDLTPRRALVQEFWPTAQSAAAPDLQPLMVELEPYDVLLAPACALYADREVPS